MLHLETVPRAEAYKALQEEINFATEACSHILRHLPGFTNDIEKINSSLVLAEQEATTVEDMPEVEMQYYEYLEYVLVLLPGFPLMYPEIDWSHLVNAFVSLLDNYVGVYETVYAQLDKKEYLLEIFNLKKMIERCARYFELGNVMEVWIPTLTLLLQEAKEMRANRPFAMQLSEAYLHALDFYPKQQDETEEQK